MPKQCFNPPELPPAIGPYSWATRHGNLIFLAGTAGIGSDGKLVGVGDIRKPEGPPARATLITGFVVPGLLVEIEAIAALD